jgi:predicted DNA-binding transcriptional regulator AlpA
MSDFSKLFQQLGALAERRSSLLMEEAKLWAEAKQLLSGAASEGPKMGRTVVPTPAIPDANDRLLSIKQAAVILNLTTSSLAKWRVYGGGPEFVKLGRRILYRQSALDSFIEAKTYPHTSAYK